MTAKAAAPGLAVTAGSPVTAGPAVTAGPGGPGGQPVLIVGNGLIGRAVRASLDAARIAAVSTGRRAPAPLASPAAAGYLALDLAAPDGRAALATAVDRLRPRLVVLTHGPSDVTWIDQNETAADAVHGGAAAVVATAGVPVVLVSTDNVFPGTRGGCRPQEPVRPANGYGRVKARAEDVLLATGQALVLRISLVYGRTGPGQRVTFAQRCLDAAAWHRPMSAPADQFFTPVHVSDVAAVLASLSRPGQPPGVPGVPGAPGGPGPPGGRAGAADIAHLAGPAELSRCDFARLAYQLAGADPGLVRSCLRRDTEWACRPRYSSLACGDFTGLPGLAGWRPLTPEQGLRAMLAVGQEVPLDVTGPR